MCSALHQRFRRLALRAEAATARETPPIGTPATSVRFTT
jgi:hypothetical protein